MALDYGAILPAQTDSSGFYPQGKAKNVSAPGAGDGTPWYANLVNDLLFGPWQHVLKLTGTVPSGVPDTATTSQHMTALFRLVWGTLVAANWTESESGSEHYNAICYSPDLGFFCAVGENGRFLVTDGFSLQGGAIGGTPNLNAVCWSESEQLFIAGGDGGALYTSPNGSIWTVRVYEHATDIRALAVKPGSPDVIVGVGGSTADDIAYSTDGINWDPATCDAGYSRYSVCWSADLALFVCGHTAGNAETSPDGITWTLVPTVGTNQMLAVAWSVYHQLFIAACAGGRIMTSPDAVTWTEYTGFLDAGDLRGVSVDETLGQIIVVGENGILSSFDGVTWYNRQNRLALPPNFNGVAFSQALSVTAAVGTLGKVALSMRSLLL